ncbi:MAG: hypothetical protein ABI442_20305 [Gemmatimonadaceae bacterium]
MRNPWKLLRVASGGVVFTTIQKFLPPKGERMPVLSELRNIVVVADEAHRSQYDLVDGAVSDRPPCIEDRAVPGHWECDSCLATSQR